MQQKLTLPIVKTLNLQVIWIWLLRGLVIATPALLVFLIVNVYYGKNIAEFVPAYPNDEVYYYRQSMAFSQVGFDAGYFTLDELPAAASFTHYGPHGPIYPMFYGTIIRMVGNWQPHYFIYLNVLFLMGALGLYIYVVQPDARQLLLTILVLMSFYPLLVYLVSTMQEALHQSIAIAIATGVFLLLQRQARIPLSLKTVIFLVLIAASLLRFTWALMVPAFLILVYRPSSLKQILIPLALGIGAALGSFLLFGYLGSPYPYNAFSRILEASKTSMSGAARVAGEVLEYNWRIAKEQPLERVLFIQVILLILISLIKLLREKQLVSQWSIHLFNLVPMLFFTMVLYDFVYYGGYRSVAAHLLVSLFILIASRNYVPVLLILLVNILAFSRFTETLDRMLALRFEQPTSQIQAVQEFSEKYLIYTPDVENDWCNTVLISLEDYQYDLIGLPDEMGVSLLLNPQLATLKSRYLLISRIYYELYRDKIEAEVIAGSPIGTVLMVNHSSDCPVPDYPVDEPLSPDLDMLYQQEVKQFPNGIFVPAFFSPSFNKQAALYLRRTLNSADLAAEDQNNLLQVLAFIEHDLLRSGDASTAWVENVLPGDLPEQADHILLSATWIANLTPVQRDVVLRNPRYYQRVNHLLFLYNEWMAYGTVIESPYDNYELFRVMSDASVATHGLSSEEYATFSQLPMPFGFTSRTAILNPAIDVLSEQSALFPIYGIYLSQDAAPQVQEDFFSVMKVLPLIQPPETLAQQQQAAYTTWRDDFEPDLLYDAGIEYLVFDEQWVSDQSPSAQANLRNPAFYVQLGDWTLDIYGRQFHLYQVMPR